ncbi:spermidine/putrescine ABC transporter substrate-binding protein, partial [Anaerolineae bacterium CFX9]|nr:spermidine/putrescine ABC transporter substrate-binding protein [Anaerolineae bacterium CFX9]
MQHKGVLLVVLAMLLLVAVPSMAQDAAATPEVELPEPWSCPEGFAGQTLSVYNWSTYIAEDTVANFEALCGVTVIYDVYDNNESMIASLSQGNPGYDIVVPTDYAVAQMIDRGLLQPLNLDNIPNFANLSDFLLDQVFDPGNQYSVPYQWGTIGIGYNIEAVGYEITSWEDVWNYNGPVAWLEEPRPMLGFALMLLGLDPNTTDPREIEMARDYLIERGGNVVAIAADDGQVFLERGDAHIVIEYSGDIFQLVATCECDTYR